MHHLCVRHSSRHRDTAVNKTDPNLWPTSSTVGYLSSSMTREGAYFFLTHSFFPLHPEPHHLCTMWTDCNQKGSKWTIIVVVKFSGHEWSMFTWNRKPFWRPLPKLGTEPLLHKGVSVWVITLRDFPTQTAGLVFLEREENLLFRLGIALLSEKWVWANDPPEMQTFISLTDSVSD